MEGFLKKLHNWMISSCRDSVYVHRTYSYYSCFVLQLPFTVRDKFGSRNWILSEAALISTNLSR